MPVTPAVTPDQATQGVQKIYDRIAQTIGNGEVPMAYQMMGHVESYLQDSYMNARKFIYDGAGKLTAKNRFAVVLATSSAMNCAHCVRSHAKKIVANEHLTEQEMVEVLAVTATCAMYNTYYKFKDLAGDSHFEGMTPGLRAHAFQKTSLDDTTVELINIVVSNINGCLKCTGGHVKKALALGLTHEDIDEAIKVSAAVSSFNTYHRTQ